MIRAGLGEPLILLHGVGGGPAHWREVMPLLAPHHDTIALSALGHWDGAAPVRRPVTIVDVIDDIERQLDRLELETAHLAGNSMGGWIALELARRGRARSVCALSPAGAWEIGREEQLHGRRVLRAMMREARLGRPVQGLTTRVPALRRYGMRMVAEHGDRMTRGHLLAIVAETDACNVMEEIVEGPFALGALDPPPCPITVAWSQMDRVLSMAAGGARARELVPGARWVVLDGLGHMPMFDDPGRVAAVILESAGAA